MCGICGVVTIAGSPAENLNHRATVMNALIQHRGPDGHNTWLSECGNHAFGHRRLSIIDLSENGQQPMTADNGTCITYNGEIYNYKELRHELERFWQFKSDSDTEVILAAYAKWGEACLDHLRGMFAFAIWDGNKIFAARDAFGIKPLYHLRVGNTFYFASEVKALLPFVPSIETDKDALADYFSFQYPVDHTCLFKGINTLLPGHCISIVNGQVKFRRYWDIHYEIDYAHTAKYFEDELTRMIHDSVDHHLISDVPVGAYISGGVDSSFVAALSSGKETFANIGFHGKFAEGEAYDESPHAIAVSQQANIDLKEITISSTDFQENIAKVIYHLDFPVAGPGSFPQFMVSKLASEHVKVVMGGQGGDEIFGGYARYLVAYLEQVLKASIEGTYKNGNFIVTPESIIPNLSTLKEYKPLIRQLFSKGLFGEVDSRYFELVNRSEDMRSEVDFEALDVAGSFERFKEVFNSTRNVRKEAYFDSMTHFDFKCLLPALLQVEDRMSMAHGLESRVPLLDKSIVEFAATIPADIKFPGGKLKHLLRVVSSPHIPKSVFNRRDKMGFPVPLKEWYAGPLHNFVRDLFSDEKAKTRPFFNSEAIVDNFAEGSRFSRKTWGLLSLELWYKLFHDKEHEYKAMLDTPDIAIPSSVL